MSVVAADGQHFYITEEHDDFSRAFEASRLNRDSNRGEDQDQDLLDDQDALLKEYMLICSKRVEMLAEDANDTNFQPISDPESLQMFELERNTWRLVAMLLEIRTSTEYPEVAIHDLSSDCTLVNHFLAENKHLSELMRVKDWLEQSAPPIYPVEIRRGYWPYTCKQAREESRNADRTVGRGPGVTRTKMELDPDGPVRQKTGLANDDLSYEVNLNRTIFEYQRRGQLADAMNLCRECDQPWKAASLSGAVLFRDAFIDGVDDEDSGANGNGNRDLWQAVCYSMASEESFDLYERAVYAALAGDVKNAVPACKTWEDLLWLHYNAMVEFEMRKYLMLVKRPNEYSSISDLNLPSESFTPLQVLEMLAMSKDPEMSAAAQNPIRLIQSFWILDRVDELIDTFKYRIEQEKSSGLNIPHILRFLTHLILCLRKSAYHLKSVDSANFIIRSYIELLIVAQKRTHIALYCAQLPSALQVECHALFFQSLGDDRELKEDFLLQAKNVGLDTHQICRLTVSNILYEGILGEAQPPHVKSVFLSSLDEPLLPTEVSQIRSLEWLLFDRTQRTDALIYSNQLVRRFLVFGRLSSAKEVLDLLPEDLIPQPLLIKCLELVKLEEEEGRSTSRKAELLARFDVQVKRLSVSVWEHMAYKVLIAGLQDYVKVGIILGQRPSSGTGTFQFKDWSEVIKTAADTAESSLREMLGPSGWLVVKPTMQTLNDEEKMRLRDLQFIRELFIPEVVIALHKVLYDTHDVIPGNLEKSIKVLDVLDSETAESSLYRDIMRSGKVPQLLELIQQAKAELKTKK